MRRVIVVGVFVAAAVAAYLWWPRTMAARPVPDVIAAVGGDLTISPIAHGTLQIEHGEHAILVDPTSRARFDGAGRSLRVNYQGLKPPTIVLVTHDHPDHYDLDLLRALRTDKGAPPSVVGPPAVASHLAGAVSIENRESKFVNGVRFDGVPMYNTLGQEKYHEKGDGNGYVISLGGKRIYIAGDTACTTEMRTLRDIDIAFLPMNLPYTMTPSEAAECANAFKPAIVYPYHYSGQDPKAFEAAVKGSGIGVRLRDWYTKDP
jgi:L-ascorbate metabolism protein UlaG (beta-lactamase superfamily)